MEFRRRNSGKSVGGSCIFAVLGVVFCSRVSFFVRAGYARVFLLSAGVHRVGLAVIVCRIMVFV